MATAILEREITRIRSERVLETANTERDTEKARREFNERISDNYQKLLRGTETAFRPVAEAKAEEAVSFAAERIAQYRTAPMTPAGKKVLFSDVTYKNGELITDKPQSTEKTMSETVVAPQTEVENEEDSMPTRRTMDTLHRAQASVSVGEQISSAISSKMKLALAVVSLVVIMAIAIICINTGVLNSLTADVSALQAQAGVLQTQAAELANEIVRVTGWENIMQFAQSLGMIIPG